MIYRLSDLALPPKFMLLQPCVLRCFIFRAPHQTFVSWNKCRVAPFHVNEREPSSGWKETAWLLEAEFAQFGIVVSGWGPLNRALWFMGMRPVHDFVSYPSLMRAPIFCCGCALYIHLIREINSR
jgi:hypothetical protein